MIRLEYKYSMSEFIGEEGINDRELKEIFEKFPTIHRNLVEKSKDENFPVGFIKLPFDNVTQKDIIEIANKLRYKFENFLVLGIGGSALGNIALQNALKDRFWNFFSKEKRKGYLKLFVLDNIDPQTTKSVVNLLDLRKTVINVISKSGNTVESLASFFIIYEKLKKLYKGKNISKHFIFTTDKEKGFLRELANRNFCFKSFVIPRNVGGRFSVLSPVGLLSAAVTGINIKKIILGAKNFALNCKITKENLDTKDLNISYIFSALNYLLYQKGKKICVMMPYSDNLYSFSDWFRQLWAESLGKAKDNNGINVNIGPTPIKALGVTDQHSQLQLYREGPNDKIIVFLSVEKFANNLKIPKFEDHYLSNHTINQLFKAEETSTKIALIQSQRPVLTISLPKINEETVGELIFMLELATAYAGELFNINAFDQPGVELIKDYTYAILGRNGYEKYLENIKKFI